MFDPGWGLNWRKDKPHHEGQGDNGGDPEEAVHRCRVALYTLHFGTASHSSGPNRHHQLLRLASDCSGVCRIPGGNDALIPALPLL